MMDERPRFVPRLIVKIEIRPLAAGGYALAAHGRLAELLAPAAFRNAAGTTIP